MTTVQDQLDGQELEDIWRETVRDKSLSLDISFKGELRLLMDHNGRYKDTSGDHVMWYLENVRAYGTKKEKELAQRIKEDSSEIIWLNGELAQIKKRLQSENSVDVRGWLINMIALLNGRISDILSKYSRVSKIDRTLPIRSIPQNERGLDKHLSENDLCDLWRSLGYRRNFLFRLYVNELGTIRLEFSYRGHYMRTNLSHAYWYMGCVERYGTANEQKRISRIIRDSQKIRDLKDEQDMLERYVFSSLLEDESSDLILKPNDEKDEVKEAYDRVREISEEIAQISNY